MKHTKHYWRCGFLLLGIFLILLIVRGLLIPHSFGEYGFYRGDNVVEQMAKPVVFAEKEACANCHDQIALTHKGAKHASVQCQNCHAPINVHIKNDDYIGAMPIDHSPQLCLRCHRKLPSRPNDFPQIDTRAHVGSGEQHLEEGVCLKCHKPHSPTP